MNDTCIPHPPGETMVLFRSWQVEACGGNLCAAALLNFFEYWHNIKLSNREQARSLNDVAEKHGEARGQDESLLQWHSTDDLRKGLLNLYGETVVQKSVKVLESLGFISIQRNPNPAYKWDKTNHYLFRPEVVIAWLRDNRGLDTVYSHKSPVKSDAVEIRHRELKNTSSTTQKYGMDGSKNTAAIPMITPMVTPENEKEEEDSLSSAGADEASVHPVPKVQELVDAWNNICAHHGRLPEKKMLTPKVTDGIRLRLKEHPDPAFWETVLNKCVDSLFLSGRKNSFRATLDWLTKNGENAIKVYEGNYDNEYRT
jgi:hypothetical protein